MTMGVMAKKVYTIRQVADLLNQPNTRINYTIDKLGIESVARIGNIRLFDELQRRNADGRRKQFLESE